MFCSKDPVLTTLWLHECLGILARLGILQYLNLFAHDTLSTQEFDEESTDSDYNGSGSLMKLLHVLKSGKKFKMIQTKLDGAKQPPN